MIDMKNKLMGSLVLACGWLVSMSCTGDAPPPEAPAPNAPAADASCDITRERVRITEIDVGATVVTNEDEVALKPLVISPIPSGGSRLAWMGSDGKVHITQLDASDLPVGTSFGLPANDFADLYADNTGGTLLLTRNAKGGGTLNCGAPTNLCGSPPTRPCLVTTCTWCASTAAPRRGPPS